MMAWQGDWPPSRPRRVEGGIKARSQRGSIGSQWWSRRFIEVLESYGMSSRLARGRNYARQGQVIGFEVTPGKVTAKVQGSRARPYDVRLSVKRLSAAQWRAVQDKLAAQALFRAKLLAGEMPDEIEEVFRDCGTPLFPGAASDLEMSCSCPDWGVPCKHVAAVCYVLAEEFDADPFRMLAWRGRGRDELLAALRSAEPAADRPAVQPSDRIGPAGAPLAASLENFWAAGLSPARLRALAAGPAPATAPDLLLRMFEPPPVQVRGRDLAEVLASAYQQFAADDQRADDED